MPIPAFHAPFKLGFYVENSVRSVIVATTTDRATARPQHRQDDADNEQDHANDQQDMRKGESRYEAGQDEPEDDKDDAEEDHFVPF
jgi:hypothetical protein